MGLTRSRRRLRHVVAAGALATGVVVPFPAAAVAPAPDSWVTCTHRTAATPKVLSKHEGHARRGVWTVAASLSCPVPEYRLQLAVQLYRNGHAVTRPLTAMCVGGAGSPVCQQLSIRARVRYPSMAARWAATTATFLLGPTSMGDWVTGGDACELDLALMPPLIVGCTYHQSLGRVR